MNLSIENYQDRGDKAKVVTIGDYDFYFSYRTCIAFNSPKTGRVICENDWGTTTGGHLNCIDSDKKIRIPRSEFNAKLQEVLNENFKGMEIEKLG